MRIRSLLILIILVVSSTSIIKAQEVPGEVQIKYRRSSLHTILIESDKFPYKDTVLQAYYKSPFPDKYNNHTVGIKSFDPKRYYGSDPTMVQAQTDADAAALVAVEAATTDAGAVGTTRATPEKQKGALGMLAGSSNKEKKEEENDNTHLAIQKYFSETKMGNLLVAKWFNRKEDGTFDMNLIADRGQYDASAMQVNIAKGTARGTAALADAGEELIGNTFVVVSKLNFSSNELAARITRDLAKAAAANLPGMGKTIAETAADVMYKKTKDGYTVFTTAYLFQLKWNDSIEAVFYNELWNDSSSPSANKKAAFDNANFEMKFVGQSKASSLVLFSGKDRGPEKIIELATIRNVDNVYAKLQKEYDVFKTKTPLYTGYPITAKIGLKEGLEPGDKFDVLEQVMDPETGKTKYVVKGRITVAKGQIWDNRYALADEGSGEEKPDQTIDKTTFNGGKNYLSGMLIKQVK
jgi:hypothetical protein